MPSRFKRSIGALRLVLSSLIRFSTAGSRAGSRACVDGAAWPFSRAATEVQIFLLTYYYLTSITTVVMHQPPSRHRLGDLQLRLMQILWDRREATVAEVHAAVQSERPLAYTTIATMLKKMEERGLITHREQGRAFLYRPVVAAEEVNKSAGRHFVDRLFAGSLANAVCHLLETNQASVEEIDRIEKLVKDAKRRAK